jgi:predicted acylesterase/phospholipase RssA
MHRSDVFTYRLCSFTRIVCATPLVDMKFCRLFRNFNTQHVSENPTIVEAIMATCSTLDIFEPVPVGLDRRKEDFVSGSYSAANPINELIKEAHELFGPERAVSCIMSVGVGGTPFVSLAHHPTTIDAKLLETVATNAEKVAEEVERRLGKLNVYFRFTVNRGLDAPQSHDQFGFIEGLTKAYLQTEAVNEKVDRVLRFLLEPGRIQIDRICKYLIHMIQLSIHHSLCYAILFHDPDYKRR